jgi:hypothetical protein
VERWFWASTWQLRVSACRRTAPSGRASNQRDFEYDFDSQTRNPRRAREGRCAADKSFAGDREALEVPGRKGNAADETD